MRSRALARLVFVVALTTLVATSCTPSPSATPTPTTAGTEPARSPTAVAPTTVAPSATVPRPTPTSTTPAVPVATPTAAAEHAIKTVFLIMMENHNWSSIQGNTSQAPYINSLISGPNNAETSYATRYYNPPDNHPSLPNYLWIEGGQCFSYCGTDSLPSQSPKGIDSTQHLSTLLKNAGISWKAYVEGISGQVCPLKSAGSYAPRHNPFVYFDDVSGDQSYCTDHERNYAELASDLTNNAVARYNFITPSLCDDMHDSCSPTRDAIKQGDTWLSEQVPNILRSSAYKDGGLLLITWDEAASGDGPIGMIALSPFAKGHGYASSVRYTHSSTLRTLEEIFGVSPLLGDAADATNLSDLFARFP